MYQVPTPTIILSFLGLCLAAATGCAAPTTPESSKSIESVEGGATSSHTFNVCGSNLAQMFAEALQSHSGFGADAVAQNLAVEMIRNGVVGSVDTTAGFTFTTMRTYWKDPTSEGSFVTLDNAEKITHMKDYPNWKARHTMSISISEEGALLELSLAGVEGDLPTRNDVLKPTFRTWATFDVKDASWVVDGNRAPLIEYGNPDSREILTCEVLELAQAHTDPVEISGIEKRKITTLGETPNLSPLKFRNWSTDTLVFLDSATTRFFASSVGFQMPITQSAVPTTTLAVQQAKASEGDLYSPQGYVQIGQALEDGSRLTAVFSVIETAEGDHGFTHAQKVHFNHWTWIYQPGQESETEVSGYVMELVRDGLFQ